MDGTATAQWKPAAWFLVTAPQPRAATSRRPRLSALFDGIAARSQTAIIMAPAGFGKTTALAAWIADTGRPVAWLTVTRHDQSAAALISGILSALQHRARESAELDAVTAIIPDSGDAALTLERICAALTDLPEPLTLVIDDAHLVPVQILDAVLAVLRDHSGGNVQLVIAGTHSLADGFTVALSTGVATLIGAETLAMTATEIAAVAEVEQHPISTAVAEEIRESTGGWPVAIRIALGAGAHADPLMPVPGDDLLAAYISRAILSDLRPELVDFVQAVTTCSRVNARLAEALSGRADAAALLNECVRRGLFLDRFVSGEREPVYRWQEVFARHCRVSTRSADAARAREFNLIAARTLATDFPTEALVHAERAQAPELAVSIIRGSWIRLVTETDADALNARCLALPDALAQSAEILLVRACCLDVEGDTTGARLLHARAEAILEAPDAVIDDHVRFTRAFAELFLAHDNATLVRAADAVRAVLGTASLAHNVHTHALFLLGWVELRLRRDPGEAVRLLSSAHRDAVAAGNPTLAGRAVTNLIFAYSYGGAFTAAQALIDSRGAADNDAAWTHYDGGIEFVARGFIDYWRGDLGAAENRFRALIEQGGHASSYAALARVYFALTAAASGDARLIAEARRYLSGISDVEAHGVPWPAYRAVAGAVLASASGDRTRALALAERLADSEASAIPVTTVLVAEIYRKAGQPVRALQLLGRIEHPERVSYVIVSALVTTALVARHQDDRSRAHRYLERALDLAVPEGIAQPFSADEDDQPLRDLLTEHAAWGTAHEGFLAAQISGRASGVSRHQVLGSALSPREREIFGFLCTTMTADEIADQLHVSVNTVRTHQRAIYRKLGVGNRREAIKLRI